MEKATGKGFSHCPQEPHSWHSPCWYGNSASVITKAPEAELPVLLLLIAAFLSPADNAFFRQYLSEAVTAT